MTKVTGTKRTFNGQIVPEPTRAERLAMPKTGGTRSWQAAERMARAADHEERLTIAWLLDQKADHPDELPCQACAHGLHDVEGEGTCPCCGKVISY